MPGTSARPLQVMPAAISPPTAAIKLLPSCTSATSSCGLDQMRSRLRSRGRRTLWGQHVACRTTPKAVGTDRETHICTNKHSGQMMQPDACSLFAPPLQGRTCPDSAGADQACAATAPHTSTCNGCCHTSRCSCQRAQLYNSCTHVRAQEWSSGM